MRIQGEESVGRKRHKNRFFKFENGVLVKPEYYPDYRKQTAGDVCKCALSRI